MTTFAEYRAIPAVNASGLKSLIVDRAEGVFSPAAYRYSLANPRPDTPAFSKGRAFHCASLESLAFPTRYLVFDGIRKGKQWTDFRDAAPDGSEILTRAEYDEVVGMAEAVLAHPMAAALLVEGESERTLTWTDKDTGLPCKCRVDHLCLPTITDLKSTADITTRGIEQAIYKYAYDMSAAHYCDGVRTVFGVDPEFYFAFVSSAAPREVRVGPIHEDALAAGEALRRELLRLVAECEATGKWPPAYQDDETEFDLPAWHYVREAAEREALL